MTPTLAGRLQTRIALAVVPGLPVTAFSAAMLDKLTPADALVGLVAITVVGLGWDAAYQAIQDRRWDRDWPRPFTLLSWIPEAFGSWLVLHLLDRAAPLGTHLAFFTALWLAALAVRAMVLPVLLPRSRHEGQRLRGVRGSTSDDPLPVADSVEQTGPQHSRARGFSLMGLKPQPGNGRLATLALFFGIVGAVVLLAPLLDNHHAGPMSADALMTKSGAAMDRADKNDRSGATSTDWDTSRRVLPSSIVFHGADLATTLTMTLMKPDGVLVTPDEQHAAWYGQGAAPGQRGPAVVIGSSDAVFKGLRDAHRGQRLQVARKDHSTVTFVVDSVDTVDAASFPTQKVYGASPRPLLRLVGYDAASGRNTIVFAHAVSLRKSPTEG
ncbi:sortase domain-bontaining protein [Nocardioides jejuensis]|uniref:Class F sortase n=1 Tax=Nocardioides jejuensis TaxID=2502782 RepID=A0A4R1BYK9_9ACTN|nr:sortase [Nocardioides jejuensis]TCJ23179.1 class F sortase [Nocardioides jejuensis]